MHCVKTGRGEKNGVDQRWQAQCWLVIGEEKKSAYSPNRVASIRFASSTGLLNYVSCNRITAVAAALVLHTDAPFGSANFRLI